MLIRSVLAWLSLAALGRCSESPSPSPPIAAKIVSSWPAPSFTALYLESLAQELPSALFPVVEYLVTNPDIKGRQHPLPAEAFKGFNPIFTPLLRHNDTFNFIDAQVHRSRLFNRRGARESLHLAIAIRESSVILEGMRILAVDREKELGARGEQDCDNWVDVAGQMACSIEAFWTIVGLEQSEYVDVISPPPSAEPPLYSFDHLSPPTRDPSLPLVVFYADPTAFSFTPSFTFLQTLSTSSPPRLQFALRWNAPRTSDGAKLVLSGYSASLDIKKSDYLAIDDRISGGPSTPVDTTQLPKMVPIKKGDMADLGLRATTYILSHTDPFWAFTHLTSTFPLLASHLSTLVPTPHPDLLDEVLANQLSSPAAAQPSFTINGISLPLASVEPFALLRIMRKERKFVTDLQRMSISRFSLRVAREILIGGAPAGSEGVGKDGRLTAEGLGVIFDAGDAKEGGGLVLWWNDLEKDRRYAQWSQKLSDLLRPTYPGQMSLIGRNLNNVVLVLDLSRPEGLNLVTESIKAYVSRGIPVRFGLVPQVGADDGPPAMVASVLWYLVEVVGRSQAMGFLSQLATHGDVTVDALRKSYSKLAMQSVRSEGGPLASFEEVVTGPLAIQLLEQARAYTKRLGVSLPSTRSANFGAFFLNGAYFVIDDDWTQNLQKTLGLHVQFLQQEVYTGKLEEDSDINTYFYDLPTAYGRRNPYIFPVPETNPLRIVNLVDATGATNPVLHLFKEFHNSYIEAVAPLDLAEDEAPPGSIVASVFVVADLDSPYGRSLSQAALELLANRTETRINLVHNPTSPTPPHPYAFSSLLSLLIECDTLLDVLPEELVYWLGHNVPAKGPGPLLTWSKDNPLLPFAKKGARGVDAHKAKEYWGKVATLVESFGFAKGENALVVNGRVVGPFEDYAFGKEDLEALLEYELVKRINPVVKSIASSSLDLKDVPSGELPRLYMLATSVVSEAYLPDTSAGLFASGTVERQQDYRQLEGQHSSIIGHNEEMAPFEIGVVIDPVSELAQKWAPIIETLFKQSTVHLRLYLNPSRYLSELPIKRFYQSTFPHQPVFNPETGAEVEPLVEFNGIPEDVLLTFAMDLQRSWLAFPKESVHDLDNIRLADLPASARAEGVQAVFELESIIVEGHAREIPAGSPPRGLQLELKSVEEGSTATVDSLVMSNLGYFQLKANPGPWRLGIRNGKSSEVFKMESTGAEGWKSGEVAETGDTLVVTTLEGLTIYPRFRRRPGQEHTDLTDERAAVGKDSKPASLVDRVQTFFPFLAPLLGSKTDTTALATTSHHKADINIFTVASGLLYERMAFLMMVSVMRHTNSTVKFWFIQNFLSPSFKAFIPHMALEYGFEYELITYKWPHWLRAQTEKQRTIWGYKILFLDVLFPLELDRVIFVDSDQIVRADLRELVDLDLKGAPYAYAPMGSDREETKGFRFWDSGYWKDHLKGRPYHISALYVVDLDRFRQIAAGDRLRQQYQGLSADPNSLSNLDQDLPNNMQQQIPIFTLDQSWLWCETWCSDESLAQAKTIDLCNNPLTHEPKLHRAKRLIPEWTVYDDEVAALAARIASEQAAASASGADGAGIIAFSKKADELVQAVEQSAERDEFVESHGGAGGTPAVEEQVEEQAEEQVEEQAEEQVEVEKGRRKDEL